MRHIVRAPTRDAIIEAVAELDTHRTNSAGAYAFHPPTKPLRGLGSSNRQDYGQAFP